MSRPNFLMFLDLKVPCDHNRNQSIGFNNLVYHIELLIGLGQNVPKFQLHGEKICDNWLNPGHRDYTKTLSNI